ncbi:cation channel sperm-associated protein 2 isoform X2 [Esox lucius]|uniref:cation channel sperm-associated protein 2 isoform X2 n=1 Tax=Esox lucius TaxID=8010 RepID=UPI000973461F|nr:cation channel sperm-associated protein 2 isoform X2 [Esox lucius]XP_019896020.1 cation channel sperm-associated protein 2 isoform X2 [Esox lucius]XP_019896021.1 cation channel sperm-associated protein 2 isoform X2 [Esox lucius]
MEPPSYNSHTSKGKPTKEKFLPRAEVIRSKLIQSFYLLDWLQEEQRGSPKYCTSDVLDKEKYTSLMGKDSHQLVRFEVSPRRGHTITMECRRQGRLKTRYAKYPPLNMFAHWILESKIFTHMMVILIILNTVVLEIQAEVFDNMDPNLEILKLILEMMDRYILAMFLVEFILKWMDDFWSFWKSTWNILDLATTLLSIIPEILKLFKSVSTANLEIVTLLKKFRILRSLKLVSKFRQTRLIILAALKAFKAMTFIFLLLLMFAYIFAVFGVALFDSYSRSNVEGLVYNMYFKDLYNSFITLFILFTTDHWYALLADTRKVPELNQTISGLYIILWLIIGSFMFSNIFVGIMVNNFQAIRRDLSKEVHQIEIQAKADHFKAEIINRRISHLKLPGLSKVANGCEESLSSEDLLKPRSSNIPEKDWELYVEENMTVMQEQEEDEKVTWPRDSLFRYFELLEMLQHNLDERQRLQNVAVQAWLNLHDT